MCNSGLREGLCVQNETVCKTKNSSSNSNESVPVFKVTYLAKQCNIIMYPS
jgi:hypothetical protein